MLHRFWLALAAFSVTPFALATNEDAGVVNPTSPAAPTPSFQYKSVLDSYQPIAEDDATPGKRWRTANEEVARIGGHAGYMKIQQASPQVSRQQESPAAEPAASAPSHHGAHDHGMQIK
jgi:hypothetical protein